MEFQRPPLKLVFESPELDGLVVRSRRLTVAEVRTITTRDEGSVRGERERTIEEILASAIRSWNYHDEDGEAVEPTAENLDSRVDPGLIGEIVSELVAASSRVAPPLPKPSDDGSPSEEEFKLMEALSSDPPSSPGPS